jgi:hypothetical protein
MKHKEQHVYSEKLQRIHWDECAGPKYVYACESFIALRCLHIASSAYELTSSDARPSW